MYVLVVYDITENDVRNRVADILRSFGLERIQKSVFLGRLPPALVKELEEKLRKATRGADADVAIFRIDRRVVDTMVRIGPAPPQRRDVQLI
ncbi:MAG: CRISPR-associated endonuclease Cas2 [Pyrobaculum sp.]